MKRFLITFVLLVGSTLAACDVQDLLGTRSETAIRDDDFTAGAPIRTDSAVYHVRSTDNFHEVTLNLAYVNTTGGNVYIPTCRSPHPPVLQKQVGSRWVTAYSPVVLMCLGPPVVIEPGATYEFTYPVMAARQPNHYPRFDVAEIPGTYRLEWGLLGTWTPDGPEPGLGTPLPLEQRISNTFRLEL